MSAATSSPMGAHVCQLDFGATGHPRYDVSPDGQRFLMVQDARGEALTEIHVVLNWTEELKRLVPTEN